MRHSACIGAVGGAGFGNGGAPAGGCSSARQASMPDSPPQAIHGLLSASPGRDAASAIRCRGFFLGNRRSRTRSEEHTSELQSLMRISYAVFCLKKKKKKTATRATN